MKLKPYFIPSIVGALLLLSFNPAIGVTQNKPSAYITHGGFTWMPVSDKKMTWDEADNYCRTTRINGKNNWQMPTSNQIYNMAQDLLNTSGKIADMRDLGWTIDRVWSSSSDDASSAYTVPLFQGAAVKAYTKRSELYVICIR